MKAEDCTIASFISGIFLLAKGTYQQNLLVGVEKWSGASLKGSAGEYRGKYRRSREKLLKRIQEAALDRGLDADTGLVKRGRYYYRELLLEEAGDWFIYPGLSKVTQMENGRWALELG